MGSDQTYFGHCFEALCREVLPEIYRREGVTAAFEIGEYWNKGTQIMLVGLRDDGWTDLGECKWGPRSPLTHRRRTHTPRGPSTRIRGTRRSLSGSLPATRSRGQGIYTQSAGTTSATFTPTRINTPQRFRFVSSNGTVCNHYNRDPWPQ